MSPLGLFIPAATVGLTFSTGCVERLGEAPSNDEGESIVGRWNLQRVTWYDGQQHTMEFPYTNDAGYCHYEVGRYMQIRASLRGEQVWSYSSSCNPENNESNSIPLEVTVLDPGTQYRIEVLRLEYGYEYEMDCTLDGQLLTCDRSPEGSQFTLEYIRA